VKQKSEIAPGQQETAAALLAAKIADRARDQEQDNSQWTGIKKLLTVGDVMWRDAARASSVNDDAACVVNSIASSKQRHSVMVTTAE
jgi:hypothetical protein